MNPRSLAASSSGCYSYQVFVGRYTHTHTHTDTHTAKINIQRVKRNTTYPYTGMSSCYLLSLRIRASCSLPWEDVNGSFHHISSLPSISAERDRLWLCSAAPLPRESKPSCLQKKKKKKQQQEKVEMKQPKTKKNKKEETPDRQQQSERLHRAATLI